MQNREKAFVFSIAAFIYGFMTVIAAVNYVIDPFEIAHSGFIKPVQEFINQRVYKLRIVDQKHDQFDSYILGTSRAQDIHPRYLEKYIPGAHAYNLSLQFSKLADSVAILRYMQKHKYTIRHLFIQIDPAAMDESVTPDRGVKWPMSLLPPRVIGGFEHWLLYYKTYYTQLMFEPLWVKWTKRDKPSPEILFDTYGVTNWLKSERLINEDHAAYIKEYFFKNPVPPRSKNNMRNFEENIAGVKALLDICRENAIDCIFTTPPLNQHDLDSWNIDYIIHYMKAVTAFTDVWTFTDYNSVTLDDHNYIDPEHCRSTIIPLMMARIFHDPQGDSAPDFGMLLTKDNFPVYEKRLRSQAALRDASLGISVP